jgi:hypothetical protein
MVSPSISRPLSGGSQDGDGLRDMSPLPVAVFDIALEPSPLKSGYEGDGTSVDGGVLGLQGGLSAVHTAGLDPGRSHFK